MPLFDFIPSPTWRDVIDILILTLITYHLFVWFRESRALRVIIGLVVLGGIYSVAKLWGLFLTTWVFHFLWQVLLILLLILFQTEIRQVLEKVSPLRYLRSKRPAGHKAIGITLADVLFQLAAEKTGALIVIARGDNPNEFLHAGQPIMALFDGALIRSIFNRHAPTHDGAVIIMHDRITHMGCILPLSENENIPEKYGTRHRAALGLAERTDAVCLVVSEERGEVASIVRGKIRTWQDPATLAAQLKEWLEGPEVPLPQFGSFFKGILLNNWKIKLSALLLVTVAWLIVASQQEITTQLTAPVRYLHIPDDLALGKESTRAVQLSLASRRSTARTLQQQDVQIQVDLREYVMGNHSIKLSTENVYLPVAVKIDAIYPETIDVNLIDADPDAEIDHHFN